MALTGIATASPALGARVVNVEGSLDALVAKGAALEAADCAVLRRGALKALSDQTEVDVAAHVAAAVVPSLAAADPSACDRVRSFLRGIEQLQRDTAVTALELQAAAIDQEWPALDEQVWELELSLAGVTAALELASSSKQTLPASPSPAAAAAAAAADSPAAKSSTLLFATAMTLDVADAHFRDLTSSTPATVVQAAKGLVQLLEEYPSLVRLTSYELPALASALHLPTLAPAAARVLYLFSSDPFGMLIEHTEGVVAALATALVQSDEGLVPALRVLGRSLGEAGDRPAREIADTDGALPLIVRALSNPDTALDAACTLAFVTEHLSLVGRRVADIEGALPALVAALSARDEQLVRQAACCLSRIAAVGPDLAARILNTEGAVEGLTAAAPGLEEYHVAMGVNPAIEALEALARTAAAGAAVPRMVAALASGLSNSADDTQELFRGCLKSMELDRETAISALELAACAGAKRTAELRARVAEIVVEITAVTVALAAAVRGRKRC